MPNKKDRFPDGIFYFQKVLKLKTFYPRFMPNSNGGFVRIRGKS